jgi:hypothetical protein
MIDTGIKCYADCGAPATVTDEDGDFLCTPCYGKLQRAAEVTLVVAALRRWAKNRAEAVGAALEDAADRLEAGAHRKREKPGLPEGWTKMLPPHLKGRKPRVG